jgi:hypothetical protein
MEKREEEEEEEEDYLVQLLHLGCYQLHWVIC